MIVSRDKDDLFQSISQASFARRPPKCMREFSFVFAFRIYLTDTMLHRSKISESQPKRKPKRKSIGQPQCVAIRGTDSKSALGHRLVQIGVVSAPLREHPSQRQRLGEKHETTHVSSDYHHHTKNPLPHHQSAPGLVLSRTGPRANHHQVGGGGGSHTPCPPPLSTTR